MDDHARLTLMKDPNHNSYRHKLGKISVDNKQKNPFLGDTAPIATVGSNVTLQQSPVNHQLNQMNAATLHLVKQDLFRRSTMIFTGEPHKFHSWVNVISHKIEGLQLEA